jgi:hypothetical protein
MALFAKDRGCTSPGCRNPISWTEIHHTTAWADGGCTDIDVLAPACIAHHAMIGPGDDHWQTVMVTDGPDTGRVAWIPPTYIDPDRHPRINRAHHPDHTIETAWQKIIAERHTALREHEERMQQQQQNRAELVASPDGDTDDYDDSTDGSE